MAIINTPDGPRWIAETSTGNKKQPPKAVSTRKSRVARGASSDSTGELLDVAREAGLTKVVRDYEEKPKLSVLERLGRGLTAFETSDALYGSLYEDKPFLKEYAKNMVGSLHSAITGRDKGTEPRHTFKDILTTEGMRDRPGKLDPVDIAGFFGDVLTDPSTFLGSTVGKAGVKGLKAGMELVGNVPKARIATEGIEGLFKPFAKIERLGDTGKLYRAEFDKFAKSTRSYIDEFVGEVASRAKGVKKTIGRKTVGKELTEAVETGARPSENLLGDIFDEIVETNKKFLTEESKRGIVKTEIHNYINHALTKEARREMDKGTDFSQFLKPLRPRLGESNPRKITGTITEINKKSLETLGYKMFEEDAFKAWAMRGAHNIQAVKTYDFLKETGAKFGKVAEKDFVDESGIKWVESSSEQLKGLRLPEPIVKHIDEMKKFLTNDEATNDFLRVFDKVQNFWKASVTGYFPAFHTRNAIGGMFNNWIAGLNNPLRYVESEKLLHGAKGVLKVKGGSQYSFDEIRQMLKEFGVIGQSGHLDVGQFLQNKVDPSVLSRVTEAPQKVMGAVENRLRTPLFLDGLKKGMTPEEAAKRVVKFHFDYMPEAFTPFERNIMKRLVPFYSWTRNNIPLQLEQILMQPAKYGAVFKARQASGLKTSSDEEETTPRWLREQFSLKGEGGYWAGFGLPFEEVTQKLSEPARGAFLSGSPLITTPIEALTGYDVFKEQRISDDTYGKNYRNMPEPMKEWLEFKETTNDEGQVFYTVNPHKKFWLEAIGARGLLTSMRLANSKEDKSNLWSLISTIKKYDFSEEDLRDMAEKEKVEALEEALLNAGLARKFEKTYIVN